MIQTIKMNVSKSNFQKYQKLVSSGIAKLSNQNRKIKDSIERDKLVKVACVVSGMQPTGNPHLGNYLGSIKNWVRLQNENPQDKRFYFIADHHYFSNKLIFEIINSNTLTQASTPKQSRLHPVSDNLKGHVFKKESLRLSEQTISTYTLLLACGIEPSKSILFVQSHVPMISELMWMTSCVVPYHWLKRMTQFKSKEQKESNLSLMIYPMLMAADIMAFGGEFVPVGKDQIQHLEFSRECAFRINNLVGKNIFPLPKPLLTSCDKILSLQGTSKKMSKSEPDATGKIDLLESISQVNEKIKKSKIDLIPVITNDKSRIEIVNLVNIMSEIREVPTEVIYSDYNSKPLEIFKNDLSDIVCQKLSEIQGHYKSLIKEQGYIMECIGKSSDAANQVACKNITTLKSELSFLKENINGIDVGLLEERYKV